MTLRHLRDDPLPPGEARALAPGLRRLLRDNPGPYTFRGTNTWIVGRGRVAVLDPGPEGEGHRAALERALAGERVVAVIVSHAHADHWLAAPALAAAHGAPLLAHGAAREAFAPDRTLADGDVVEGEGWRLTALHTPGHRPDHLCFSLEADPGEAPPGALLTADHAMAWSTSVVSPPEGRMADYLTSLRRLIGRDDRLLLPGHGPPHPEPGPYLAALLAHRLEREERVRLALRATGSSGAEALVPAVYGPALDPRLAPAAARSLLAHLIKLAEEGEAVREEGEVFRAP